tara:strand:- start:70 stop:885 length:816 start_codon:yes stop_codon:yes gene_type:complete
MIRHVKGKRMNSQLNEEKRLREVIRGLMDHEMKNLNEEERFRTIVRTFIKREVDILVEGQTPDTDPTPNKSTGINVLEDLLKKIVPVLETDYKMLTTADSQRQSFRAHIVNAVIDTLTPAKTNNAAESGDEEALEEVVDVDIGGEDEDKFIDIRTDAEISAEEEEEEADPREEFGTGVEGEDETGRNMAYESFKKIESNVIDSYELLSDTEDQELFYDYLIANLKLYFDKFEGELTSSVEEPTNAAYDTAAAEAAAPEAGLEGGAEEELEF